MYRKIFLLVLCLVFAGTARLDGAPLELVTDGKSPYRIVVSARASGSEKHGAAELSAFLKKMSGADIPVVTDTDAPKGPMILVGRSAKLDELGIKIPWKDLGDEGYVIRTAPPHLVLAGGRVRGAMYACYGLLEDHLGCHWLLPGVDYIPRRKTIRVGPLDETVKPAFEYRHVYNINVRDALWCVRNRLNDVHPSATIPPAMGGQLTYRPFVHSFFNFLPPRRYFKDHPEFFSEINGVRVAENGQLCLSNPHVLDIVTEGVLRLLRKHPEVKIVSVSQMDWGGYCTCGKCRALDEREGTPAASIIRFVNRVAERVEKEFPNVAIDTLAYQYSLKAPKTIRPRRNVIVRVCSIKCCFSHPLEKECTPETKAFVRALKDWAKLTDRIYVWNYNINFSYPWQPHPNFNVLGPNARFFRDNNVKGVFEESGGSAMPKLTALGHLRAYVMAKHLWKPDYDDARAVSEFLAGYYGPAAGCIDDYMKLIHEAARKTGAHLPCHGNYRAPYISDEQIEQAQAIFDRAEKAAAADTTLLTRVRLERLSLDWLTIFRAAVPYTLKGNRMVRDVKVSEGLKATAARFFATVESAGPKTLGEKAYKAALEMKKNKFNFDKTIPVVRLSGGGVKLIVIPELGGRIWSIVDAAGGADLAHRIAPESPRYLTAGGLTDWLESPVRGLGPKAPFTVVSREEDADGVSLTLSSALTEDLLMRRTIRIDEKARARFTVTSSVTNRGKKARTVCFRTHPELSIAAGGELELYVASPDGSWEKRDIEPFIKRRNTWFAGAGLPAGAWALFAPGKKLGLLVRFRVEQVPRTLLYADAGTVQTLELYSRERKLKPGESVSVEAAYEIIHQPPK